MRGSSVEGRSLFECVGCGERYWDPDTRLCSCGATLRNISVERPA
jgi:hypothetical protein